MFNAPCYEDRERDTLKSALSLGFGPVDRLLGIKSMCDPQPVYTITFYGNATPQIRVNA
jgi:hypothetical protein